MPKQPSKTEETRRKAEARGEVYKIKPLLREQAIAGAYEQTAKEQSNPHTRSRPEYVPTVEEIAEACEAIKATWSAKEFERRRRYWPHGYDNPAPDLTPELVPVRTDRYGLPASI